MQAQPLYIIGSCSAETREQVLLTARRLKEVCGDLPFVFRAGVWKPRTSPHTFQGAGTQALEWLQAVQREFGLRVATEVATPEHAQQAIKAGIDYLWIGARTSANPIAVQAIADAIKESKVSGVLVKNPVNADADLWIGNIERIEQTGVPVLAVHRGCNHQPCWAMAHRLRQARPDIPLLLDPSHMSGDADRVPILLQKMPELQMDGAMIEVHPDPANALSDRAQQINPEQLADALDMIASRICIVSGDDIELQWLRAEIDELDNQLWQTMAARMSVSERIGHWKKGHGVAPLQPERYAEILALRKQWAAENDISADFVEQIMDRIHQESLKRQK